jgi:lipopolysaccharide biosynthesis protein
LARITTSRDLTSLPAWSTVKPLTEKARWIVYFIYLPAGPLTAAHLFTLARLRQATAGLVVVCASPTIADVPADLAGRVDALYWKALPGFDFSAYGIALREIARSSPGADVLVLNDSILGPFDDVDLFWKRMKWELTGFSASAQIQNHIQSYAFHLKSWDLNKKDELIRIFPESRSFNTYKGAVYRQESLLASEAARSMSVGAFWYADYVRCNDPTIYAALPLLDAGFPFLKKSLLTRNRHVWRKDDISDALRDRDHPVEVAS